ncbi:unnamed protein product [Medioppia subpectinata]|uniref:Uncharacterized protein n=1 Tax=Medioppia subpectinata TaxID=1979941 RepID=A0A7R9KIJ0_9ACAR|nr:unnamed protein product [Medioppia subpectinata]CAG2104117.1 unnamed protein product [Medioppia subpectinata]
MSRSGSAIGRSFLDDLLADDLDKPNTTPRRKSVRFMDSDDENNDIFGKDLMSTAANRQTSGRDRQRGIDPSEWTQSDALNTSSKQKSGGKSDWLGLDNDDEPNRPNAQISQDVIQKPSIDQKDDWLNSGLSARKSRSTTEPLRPTIDPLAERGDENSWTTIRKRAEESKLKVHEQKEDKTTTQQLIDNKIPVNSMTAKAEIDSTPIKPNDQMMQNLANNQTIDKMLDTNNSQANSSYHMLLQTQIKMLELEKTYLQQTLEQIKSNHSQEMKIMTELHE